MFILPVSNQATQTPYSQVHTSNENYLGRVVEWIREDRPLYQQVLVYTAVVLAMLALTASIVGIPLIINALTENDRQAVASKVSAGDHEIMAQFGGRAQFEKLPHRTISRLNWDNFQEISPRAMQESIERTTDQFDRPGILLRLRDTKTQRVFVQAIFRKFVYEPVWDFPRGTFSVFTGDCIDDAALEQLGKIINDQDRRYVLH